MLDSRNHTDEVRSKSNSYKFIKEIKVLIQDDRTYKKRKDAIKKLSGNNLVNNDEGRKNHRYYCALHGLKAKYVFYCKERQ